MNECLTFAGVVVDLDEFRATDVDPRHLAHSLAGQFRCAAASPVRITVAEHSVRGHDHFMKRYFKSGDPDELAAAFLFLLHDCGEAYVSDIPLFTKRLAPAIVALESRILEEICLFFGVESPRRSRPWDLVWSVDEVIFGDEFPVMWPGVKPPASLLPGLGIKFCGWSCAAAEQAWMRRLDLHWHG